MQKNKIIAGVAVVVLMGGSFYAGTLYGAAHGGSSRGQFAQFGQGTGAGELQGRTGMGVGMGAGMRSGQGAVAGEVIAKDATSMTVKMQDGSTKIVLIGASTEVLTSSQGTVDDVAVGAQVSVVGESNTDGSVTAKSVQIRPAGAQGVQPAAPQQ